MTTETAYKARDGRWMIKVVVADQEQYGAGPMTWGGEHQEGSLDAVVGALIAIRESIPEEYRASASCEIDSVSGYEDSHYAHIWVGYTRPATSEEIAESEALAAQRNRMREQEERATLARLKAKYGSA